MTGSSSPIPRLPTPIPSPPIDPCDELGADLLFSPGLDLDDGENDEEALDLFETSQWRTQGRRTSSWPYRGSSTQAKPSYSDDDSDDDTDVESFTSSPGNISPPTGLRRSSTDPYNDLRRGLPTGGLPSRFTWFSANKSPSNGRSSSKTSNGRSNGSTDESSTDSAVSTPTDNERVETPEADVAQEPIKAKIRRPLNRSYSTGHQVAADKQAKCPSLLAGLGRKNRVSSDTALFPVVNHRKSTAADTAITLTDVLALPSTPSSSGDKASGPSPKASTVSSGSVQIVESRNGIFEVVWDDPDSSDDSDEHQPEPSRGQFLKRSPLERSETDTSTGPSLAGLHRVNTQLLNWSWSDEADDERNRPGRCRFKPEVQVFSDDGLSPDSEVADNDLHAPPSSELPSGHSSREESQRPTPRRFDSRMAVAEGEPGDGNSGNTVLEDISEDPATGRTSHATIPGPYVDNKLGQVAANSRRRQLSNLVRRLSNLPEKEEHFKGHRDSLACYKMRGLHPISSKHRDSVAVYKRRLRDKLHRTPTAPKDIPVKPTQQVRFGGLSPIPDASPPTGSAAGSWERAAVTPSIDQVTGPSATRSSPNIRGKSMSPPRFSPGRGWPLPSGAPDSPSSPPKIHHQGIAGSPRAAESRQTEVSG